MTLTVIHSFGKYQKGDQIVDQAEIAAIVGSEQEVYVVRTPDLLAETKPKAK